MQKERLVKPIYVQLNCIKFKININKLYISCCTNCHTNSHEMWPIRQLAHYSFLVCCTVGKICIKRKYSV